MVSSTKAEAAKPMPVLQEPNKYGSLRFRWDLADAAVTPR